MAKRIAILSCLIIAAVLAGLLGARMLGGPFISPNPQDSRAVDERYALGRDIYRAEDYTADRRYAPYHPGSGRIATPSVPGARKIEPYEAARPDHRVAFDAEDGNFMEATDLPVDDYAMIDPPARPKSRPVPPTADGNGPENLLPRSYVRTERPNYPSGSRPARSDPTAPVQRSDPVTDTEQRIMSIARSRGASRPASSDPADGKEDAPGTNDDAKLR